MQKARLAVLLLALSFAFSCASCNKETKRNNVPPEKKDNGINSRDLPKKYLDEGFISNEIYRVVILAPKKEYSGNMPEVEEKAKTRIQSSIEKYLMSRNKTLDNNVKAGILNLINSNGKLDKKDFEWNNSYIFYFEIRRENLKKYINNL